MRFEWDEFKEMGQAQYEKAIRQIVEPLYHGKIVAIEMPLPTQRFARV